MSKDADLKLEDVDEEGVVQNRYEIETYYRPPIRWTKDKGEDFVRLVCDDPVGEIETRLTLAQIDAMMRSFLGGKTEGTTT